MKHSQDVLISVSAVLLSAVSLGVALSANHTQERLLAASTWPHVQYGTGNRGEDGSDVISLFIDNAGVGPARIKTLTVLFDGKPQPDSRRLLAACCGVDDAPLFTVTSSPGSVLKVGEGARLLRFPRQENDAAVWQRFNTERFKVSVRACYCSVLGECWQMDSAQPDADPEPIEQCPHLSAQNLWHG